MNELPPALRDWVEARVDAPLLSVQRLKGSTTSALFRIQTPTADYVLRVFDDPDWLAEEADLVAHEAAALSHVARYAAHTPRLITCETDPQRLGVPVLLMSMLPGAVQLLALDHADWLLQLAATLFELHQIPPADFRWQYRRWYRVEACVTPHWTAHPDLWESMRRILAQPAPPTVPCFIHRDYHPTNVLFDAGRISGVVDWVNACVGSAAVDLAHCRNNLVCLYGVESADAFLSHYRALAASADPYHPYWDLNGFAEFFGGLQIAVYPPWLDFGMDTLTDALIQRRADAYLASIFARLGVIEGGIGY